MITSLKASTFDEQIGHGDWMVVYSVASCYFCAQTMDIITKAIEPKRHFNIGRMDAITNIEFVSANGIKAFPTVEFYRDGVRLARFDQLRNSPDSTIYRTLYAFILKLDSLQSMSLNALSCELDTAMQDSSFEESMLSGLPQDAQQLSSTPHMTPYYATQMYNALKGETRLVNLRVPDSVEYILPGAYENCSELQTAVLPHNAISAIEDKTFFNCSKLREVVIPDNITTIKPFAFGYCTSLTSVIMHDGIDIHDYAFHGCINLHKSDLSGYADITYGTKAVYD